MKMDDGITVALCIMVIVLVVSLIMVFREASPQTHSCNSTLPGCGERFFNMTTVEDVERAGGILDRSVEEIVEDIIQNK